MPMMKSASTLTLIAALCLWGCAGRQTSPSFVTAGTTPTGDADEAMQVPMAIRTGYAEANGLNMYYEVHGRGQPMVALHGAYMSVESMRPLIAELTKTHQVIAMDLQAHGRTADVDRPITYEQMADDVAALMREVGVSQADVFGYSMGAGTAYQLAIRHPERVRRLVAVSGTYRTEGMYPELVAMIGQMTAEFFADSPMEAEYKAVAPHPENFRILVEKLVALDVAEQAWPAEAMRTIDAPTLVLSADADIVRPEHSVEIFRLRGGGPSADFMAPSVAELAIIPGTTHTDLLEKTALWMPLVRAFLDKPLQ